MGISTVYPLVGRLGDFSGNFVALGCVGSPQGGALLQGLWLWLSPSSRQLCVGEAIAKDGNQTGIRR